MIGRCNGVLVKPSTPRTEFEMQRSLIITALVLAGLTASPALVLAQANPAATDQQDTTVVQDTTAVQDRATMDHREDRDWGWLGLFGLAGLLGLRRRERETRENVRVRQPGQPI
jgi:MYXO-CTERM domain-containing protein